MKNTPEKWGITLAKFDDPTATWGRTIIKDPSVGSDSYFYDNLPVRLQRGLLTSTGDYDAVKMETFFFNKAQQVIDGIVYYRSILQKIKEPVFTSLPVAVQSYTERAVLQVINYALQNSYDEKTTGSNVAVSGLTISDNLSSWTSSKAMFGTAAGTSLMLSGLHKMTIDGDKLKYDDKLLTINFDGNHTLVIDGVQHTLAEWLKIGHQEDLAKLEKKVEKNVLDISNIPVGNIVDLSTLTGTALWTAWVKHTGNWVKIFDTISYYAVVSSGVRVGFQLAQKLGSNELTGVYVHKNGIATGRVYYNIVPSSNGELANKKYVDTTVQNHSPLADPQIAANTGGIFNNQKSININKALIANLKMLNIEGQLRDDVADNAAMIALKADKNDWVHNIAQKKFFKFDTINWIPMNGINSILASAEVNATEIAANKILISKNTIKDETAYSFSAKSQNDIHVKFSPDPINTRYHFKDLTITSVNGLYVTPHKYENSIGELIFSNEDDVIILIKAVAVNPTDEHNFILFGKSDAFSSYIFNSTSFNSDFVQSEIGVIGVNQLITKAIDDYKKHGLTKLKRRETLMVAVYAGGTKWTILDKVDDYWRANAPALVHQKIATANELIFQFKEDLHGGIFHLRFSALKTSNDCTIAIIPQDESNVENEFGYHYHGLKISSSDALKKFSDNNVMLIARKGGNTADNVISIETRNNGKIFNIFSSSRATSGNGEQYDVIYSNFRNKSGKTTNIITDHLKLEMKTYNNRDIGLKVGTLLIWEREVSS